MKSRSEKNFEQILFKNVKEAHDVGIYLNGILNCIDSAFEGGVTREDSLNHISGDIVTVLLDEEKNVRGFSSTVFGSPRQILGIGSRKPGCYLQGATVSKEIWGSGAYKQMNELRIQQAILQHLPLVFTRTQNPRVERGVLAVLDKFKQKKLIKRYQLKRTLVRGCYGTMLTKDKPKLDKSDTGKAFGKLDFEAGDAYVLEFRIRY